MIHRRVQEVLGRPIPGAPPRPRPPVPVRATLSNGLRVLAVRRSTLPQIAIRTVVPAGAAADPGRAQGLATLVGGLLTEGTASLSSEELNRRLDQLGASLSVQVGHDFAEIDLLLLKERLEDGLRLLGLVLAEPSFPEPELERVRAETSEALEARLDEPANVADDVLAETIFGTAHPYGRLPLGTVETVQTVERAQVVSFHSRHYRPAGSVLVAAGDLDPEPFAELLEATLGEWRGTAARPVLPDDFAFPPTRPRIDVPWEDAQQAEIRVGGRGMQRRSEDWVPAALANYLLGGSTITGRLGSNLREDKGWTYGVRSGFSATVGTGAWGIETAVDTDVAGAAVEEIIAELDRFIAEPVPEDELRRGKDALILSLPRAFETPGRIVSRLATVEIFGLAEEYWQTFPDRLEAVTAEEVQRVAGSYFDPARLTAVTVGG